MKQLKKVLAVLLVSLLVIGTAVIAFADTTDSGDTADKAATLTVGTPVADSISSASDVDYFKTTNTTTGAATITFRSASATGTYKVEVLDKNQASMLTFDVAAGIGDTASREFSVAASTVYYIKVSAGTVASNENYTLTMTVAQYANYEAEPNNAEGTATPIDAASITDNLNTAKALTGVIEAGDVDYWKFATTNGYGKFFVKFYNDDTNPAAYKVTVLKNLSEDKTIAVMDVSKKDGNVVGSDIGEESGTFYIKVEGATATDAGKYQFRVCQSALDAEWEIEYNGDKDNATVLAQGTKRYASIAYAEDRDFYKVTANKDTKITVKAQQDDSRNDSSVTWTAQLYKSDSTSAISTVTVSYAQNAVFDLSGYDQGIYYVVVTAGSNFSKGNYVINSEKIASSSDDSSTSKNFQYYINLIKELPWADWWNNNFAPLLSNIDIWSTLAKLFTSSFGTILQYIIKTA